MLFLTLNSNLPSLPINGVVTQFFSTSIEFEGDIFHFKYDKWAETSTNVFAGEMFKILEEKDAVWQKMVYRKDPLTTWMHHKTIHLRSVLLW